MSEKSKVKLSRVDDYEVGSHFGIMREVAKGHYSEETKKNVMKLLQEDKQKKGVQEDIEKLRNHHIYHNNDAHQKISDPLGSFSRINEQLVQFSDEEKSEYFEKTGKELPDSTTKVRFNDVKNVYEQMNIPVSNYSDKRTEDITIIGLKNFFSKYLNQFPNAFENRESYNDLNEEGVSLVNKWLQDIDIEFLKGYKHGFDVYLPIAYLADYKRHFQRFFMLSSRIRNGETYYRVRITECNQTLGEAVW